MTCLEPELQARLIRLATTLVDQDAAREIVPPQANASGFWFGGGNMIEDANGDFTLVGRYRNVGDSRTGVGAGQRGLELAVFRSHDRGQSFEKVLRFSKPDLNVGDREVISIEGSALRWTDDGVELFVSTEKTGIDYPPGLETHLKPGCGVWTIEHLQANSIEELGEASATTIVESPDPQYLHVKDPVVYDSADGDLVLMFCSHPYCWSSSNTGYTLRRKRTGRYESPRFDFFARGCTWDVAMTRGTCILDVPQIGAFQDRTVALLFYDGGECVRSLEEHESAVKRPRGYSCEELGGVAYFLEGDLDHTHRLSTSLPLFVSPKGTGCSRYVDVLATEDGYYATWQQSQEDLSQPLVMNFVSHERIAAILA
jgi:hypothetical protein